VPWPEDPSSKPTGGLNLFAGRQLACGKDQEIPAE